MQELVQRDPDAGLDDLVGRVIVYRPGNLPAWGRQAERSMIAQHLAELAEPV